MWWALGWLFLNDAQDRLTRTPAQRRAANAGFLKFLGWFMLPFVILLLIGQVVHGQTIQRTYQDSMGRNVGRSSTDTRGNTTFYNSLGQNTGRASTQNGTTTVYDNMGRQTGTIRSNR
jgi:hypothetical protein